MRPVVLMWVQHHVTGAAFLGHSHRLVIHSQLRPRKSRPLSPTALPGHPLPSCLVPPSNVPCRVIRSSYPPTAGWPLCPGRGAARCQWKKTRGSRGASLTQLNSQRAPTDLVALAQAQAGFRDLQPPLVSSHPGGVHGGVAGSSMPAAKREH